MIVRLRIIDDEDEKIHDILTPVTTIGRAPENTIQLTEVLAAPFHCQIAWTGVYYKLIDLESSNGTQVNEKHINLTVLSSGDIIQIGDTKIYFEMIPEKAEDKALPRKRASWRLRSARIKSGYLKKRNISSRKKSSQLSDEQLVMKLENELVIALESIEKYLGEDGLILAKKLIDEFVVLDSDNNETERVSMELLSRFMEISGLLNSQLNFKKLLNLSMDIAVELTNAERGFLILREESGDFHFEVARNFDKEAIKNPEFKVSKSIADKVSLNGESILSTNALDDERFQTSLSVAELKLRSILCVALKHKNKVTGVLYLDNRFANSIFTERDLVFLELFASQAAIAIENAQLLDETEAQSRQLKRSKNEIETLLKEKELILENQNAELMEIRGKLFKNNNEDKEKQYSFSNIIGVSKAMHKVFRLIEKLITTDISILIQGESGTGKELAAKALHMNGPRKNKRFISENCAAIPDALFESELFGYKKGAFTGAVKDKEGMFVIADKGTIFLDEIGELNPQMQKKLLRVIETKEVRPVGGKDTIKVDVRIISATNKNLEEMIREGKFREDLYYRLNIASIELPSLRERRDDIPILIEHFLAKYTREEKIPLIDKRAMEMLKRFDWPGNVRELENEIHRALTVCENDVIRLEDLSEKICNPTPAMPSWIEFTEGASLKDIVYKATAKLEKLVIEKTLEKNGGHKSKTAQSLGVSRPTLDSKLEKYNL